MITPGFFSFFNTHRALMTSQNALNVVNQNISNANTEGYTRQRAEITAYDPYQEPSVHAFTNGQMGQGSIVSKIERLRDAFIDGQFRNESSVLGFNEVKTQVLQQIEGILAEPSESGISAAMERFFAAAHELSLHPESIPVRQDYMQTAADFITVVQQVGTQLDDLRTNLVGNPSRSGSYATSQAGIMTNQINELLASIAGLNQQILTVSASNAEPNDLLDKRDLLIDKLSELIDITTVQRNNNLVDIYIGDNITNPTEIGLLMVQGVEQVDSLEYVANQYEAANPAPPADYTDPFPYDVPGFLQAVNTVNAAGNPMRLNEGFVSPVTNPLYQKEVEISSGKIFAVLEMGRGGGTLSIPGPAVEPPTDTTVRTVYEDLDKFMDRFGQEINQIQTDGINLNGNPSTLDRIFIPPAGYPAVLPGGFNPSTHLDSRQMLDWSINTDLLEDPSLVAAAIDDNPAPGNQGVFAGEGDGRNAIRMLQLRDTVMGGGPLINLNNSTFSNFLSGVTSEVGIQGRTFIDRFEGQISLVGSLESQRDSVSGVNVDEEMIDMLRFQRSFEASSKMMAALDEIIQTIINIT